MNTQLANVRCCRPLKRNRPGHHYDVRLLCGHRRHPGVRRGSGRGRRVGLRLLLHGRVLRFGTARAVVVQGGLAEDSVFGDLENICFCQI
jgi:hypothetical protein